eukprot:TRINITY_DN6563_c0_g1_i1.p1 TRINITY_DN6563_c0_g1~~TRINITY_DN6563_c0_g1_i1.p1  ORF type:complete len:201 (-),score=43.65 TRINITY_DN6563_c0_g1_i1:100-702(-)
MGGCFGKSKTETKPTRNQVDRPDEKTNSQFRILLLGDSGVGKTSLLLRFVDNSFTDAFINNIGGDYREKQVTVGKASCTLQIWDTAGQERFRQITSSFYRGAHGILVVFDLNNRESFDNLQRGWMKDIHKYSTTSVSIILVGNKADTTQDRAVSLEDAKAYAEQMDIPYVETSAKSNTNVETTFMRLVESMLKNEQADDG